MTATALTARRTEVGGRAVEYLEVGSGPPVVFLHGDGDSARDWPQVMEALAPDHRAIAVSLPGHGESDAAEDADPRTLARCIIETIDALHLGQVSLVGHSLGGLVAVHVALERGDGIDRLVLASSAGLGRVVNPFLAFETLPGVGEAAVAATLAPLGSQQRAMLRASMLFAQPWRVPPSWWLDQVRFGQRAGFLAAAVASKRRILDGLGQHHVVLNRLAEISVPTLVTWGVLDRVVPFSHGQAAVERLPNGRLELIAGAGHLAHVEDPHSFIMSVGPFLAGESATTTEVA